MRVRGNLNLGELKIEERNLENYGEETQGWGEAQLLYGNIHGDLGGSDIFGNFVWVIGRAD